MTEFNGEWLEMLKGIGARNMIWGVQGGNEWISYKQNCDNDFSVQIFTHDGFEVYKTQKNAIVDFFQNRNSVLVSERDVKKYVIFFINLILMKCNSIGTYPSE